MSQSLIQQTAQPGDEDLESFRVRARAWLAANMPRSDSSGPTAIGDARWDHARALQRTLFDGGFAGICFPKEYGGRGLPVEYQQAFSDEARGYEMPVVLNVPTFAICAATLLDMGSEEQKTKHITSVLRGEEVLVQLLSEPRGGSDLAGLTTRATRDGDTFYLNGSKIWSSGAYAADYGLCLTRTDWDAPKHRGLTMFLVKIHQPGIEVRRIKQVNGNDEFCQEFFDDVPLHISDVIGEVNGGWTVASRQLYHERNAVGGASPYVSGHFNGSQRGPTVESLIEAARAAGTSQDGHVRALIAEARVLNRVHQHLIGRVLEGTKSGQMSPSSGALIRLLGGESNTRRAEIGVEVSGGNVSTIGPVDPDPIGQIFVMRQAGSLGGGSVEMSRNVISERILEMPREFAADRDVPFSQVRQGV